MSLSVISWVLDESEARLGPRLVLLALADYAHDDGSKAFPSVETLARKARLSERGARDALRKLEADGMIARTGKTKYGTVVYTVIGPFNEGGQNLPGGSSEGGQISALGLSDSAPDPSVEPSKAPSSSWRGPKKVNGKQVSRDEEVLATQVLDKFNAAAETRYSGTEWLRAIVCRIRDHPDLAFEHYAEVIEEQMKHPWWEGPPSPSVIFGNAKVFDRALNGDRGVRRERDDSLDGYTWEGEQPTGRNTG